jgi:O-antigen ligase
MNRPTWPLSAALVRTPAPPEARHVAADGRSGQLLPGRGLDRLAALALLCLAASLGFGDVAPVSPLTTLVSSAIHALPPLVISLAVLAALLQRRWPRFPASLAAACAVWLAVLVASAATASQYRDEAIASLAGPTGGVLLAWAVCEICTTRHRWRRAAQVVALGGLLIASIAVAEATRVAPIGEWLAALRDGEIPIGDVPRVAATLSHPNEAAMLLELALPLLVAFAWTAAPRWRRPLGLAALATLLAITLTFSRAGIIAAVVALGLLALVSIRRPGRRRLATLGVAVLALPLALGWASAMDPGLDRRLLAGFDESSVDQPPRTLFWSTALEMFGRAPLLGVGPGNFRWLFASYSGLPTDNLGIHAHNQYLESLADTGGLGLLSFIALLIGVMRVGVDQVRHPDADWPWRAALLASLAAWLVHAILDDFERFWPTSVAFWLIVGLTLCLPPSDKHDRRLAA